MYQQKKRQLPRYLSDVFQLVWENHFLSLLNYHKEFGDFLVPYRYKTQDGLPLGFWVSNQRALYKKNTLFASRVSQLNKIGFTWVCKHMVWDANFNRLKAYKKQYKDMIVPKEYITKDGYLLGFWVSNQRRCLREGRLSLQKINKLNAVGFVWHSIEGSWERNIKLLIKYKGEYGDTRVNKNYIAKRGAFLGHWVNTQRMAYKNNKLSVEKINQLNSIGFIWRAMLKP